MAGKSKKPKIRRLAREWALQFLYQEEIHNDDEDTNSLEIFWQQLRKSPGCPKQEKYQVGYEFASEIIAGVEKNQEAIDGKIAEIAKNWEFDRIAVIDKSIMRVSAYELLYTDTPKAIVINEALEIAKTFSDNDSKVFINGILDKMVGQK